MRPIKQAAHRNLPPDLQFPEAHKRQRRLKLSPDAVCRSKKFRRERFRLFFTFGIRKAVTVFEQRVTAFMRQGVSAAIRRKRRAVVQGNGDDAARQRHEEPVQFVGLKIELKYENVIPFEQCGQIVDRAGRDLPVRTDGASHLLGGSSFSGNDIGTKITVVKEFDDVQRSGPNFGLDPEPDGRRQRTAFPMKRQPGRDLALRLQKERYRISEYGGNFLLHGLRRNNHTVLVFAENRLLDFQFFRQFLLGQPFLFSCQSQK